MSRSRLPLAVLAPALLVAFLTCSEAQTQTTKIMPLGDSITESVTTFASYRYWLWKSLEQAGYDVDFVGSRTGVLLGPPRFEDFDQDHEGHTGFRTDQILAQVHGWAEDADPDIVLIHLGTNDLWQGRAPEDVLDDIRSVIGELRDVNPEVVILLAKIIPSTAFEVRPLNRGLHRIAVELWRPRSPVHSVDQWYGFKASMDTWDGVHPDEDGEKKIAARFFGTLGRYLRDPIGPTNERPGTDRQSSLPSSSFSERLGWNLRLQRTLLSAGFVELDRLRASY